MTFWGQRGNLESPEPILLPPESYTSGQPKSQPDTSGSGATLRAAGASGKPAPLLAVSGCEAAAEEPFLIVGDD